MPTSCTPQRNFQMTTKTLKNTSNATNQQKGIDLSLPENIFDIKEFTIVSHIEALKRIASDSDGTSSKNLMYNSNTSSSCLPMLFNVNVRNNNNSSLSSDIEPSQNQYKHSPSHDWTVDPAFLPGKLQQESKFGNLTIEEVRSQSPSTSDHVKNKQEPVSSIGGRILIKGRRKSLKSGKKKSGKKKNSASNQVSALPKVSKDYDSILPSQAIDGLSALCSSVVIHSKNSNDVRHKKCQETLKHKLPSSNSILSRKNSIVNKSSDQSQKLSVTNNKQSIASTSLNNALAEYNKRNPSMCQSVQIQPKKKSSSNTKEETTTQPRKIYLSEKQSGVISDAGTMYPCAPPATPTAEQARKYNYVPSLHDIRAQRSFRQRLQFIESKVSKKEKKKEDENLKQEQVTKREKRLDMKRRQRLEIYALNKVMTDLEQDMFHQFMSSDKDKADPCSSTSV